MSFGSRALMADTRSGDADSHQPIVSMKCPPSPTKREPASSEFWYQLSGSSEPALTL